MRFFSLLTLAMLLFVMPVTAQESVPPVEAEDTTSGLPVPEGLNDAEIEAAIAALEKEIADFEAEHARRTAEQLEAIEAEQTKVAQLAARELELRDTAATLADEINKLEEALFDIENNANDVESRREGLESELKNQALDLKERLEGSLTARQYPELLEQADAILTSTDSAEERLDGLLALYTRLLEIAGTVSSFEERVKLAGTEGRTEVCQVLRIGLVGGYYSLPGVESGFVVNEGEGEGEVRLAGRAQGLGSSRTNAIEQLVTSPGDAITVPVDVTGGAGMETLASKDSLARWFEKGGHFMWPLVALLSFAALIILERMIMLTLRSIGVRKKIDHVVGLIRQGKLEQAENYCRKTGGSSARVMLAALVYRDNERAVMEDSVQEALLNESPKFQNRLSYIALAAAIAPLMGLLGTVTGMITTFKMVTIFGTSDPRLMAGGISEALITTQGGLYVAIPCLLFRGILGAVAEGAIARLETGAMSVVLAILEQQEQARIEAGSPGSGQSMNSAPPTFPSQEPTLEEAVVEDLTVEEGERAEEEPELPARIQLSPSDSESNTEDEIVLLDEDSDLDDETESRLGGIRLN